MCVVGALLTQETALDGILYSDSDVNDNLCPLFAISCVRWAVAAWRSKCLNIFMFVFYFSVHLNACRTKKSFY